MRRIILMLMATALMVALMGASALPAFAQVGDPEEEQESGDIGDGDFDSQGEDVDGDGDVEIDCQDEDGDGDDGFFDVDDPCLVIIGEDDDS